MSDPRFRIDVGRTFVARAPMTRAFGLWMALALVGAIAADETQHVGHVGASFVVYGVVTALLGIGLLATSTLARGDQSYAVVVDEAGIHFDARLAIPRAKIREARAAASIYGSFVDLRIAPFGEHLRVRVRDLATARAIVEGLGHAPDAALARFSAISRSSEDPRALAVIAILPILLGILSRSPVSALGSGAILFLTSLLVPTRVDVGADGILERWLLWRRFTPVREIADVEQMPARVRLHLRSGRSIDIVGRGNQKRGSNVEVELLAERVREIVDLARTRAAALDPAILARGDRSLEGWKASLRDLLRPATFRDSEVSAAQLWSAVEDGSIPASRRAAAAVALSSSLDQEGRARLRVVAGATAAPQLRVALEATADGDDRALDEALRELDSSR